MRIPRRNILLETITPVRNASFVYRRFKLTHFPFNWHYHPELELTMIVKGRGLRFVGDSVRDYREGDVCFLGANTPHTWHSKPARGQSVASIVIQFLPNFLGDRFLTLPETHRITELFKRARSGLQLNGRLRQSIGEQMLRMRKDPVGSMQHVVALVSMLNQIAESSESSALSVATVEPVLNRQASRTINAVCSMINANLEEIPPQSEAAKLARLSPQAFSRFFRRCVGHTYVQYVNELRIGAACRALLETDKSVTQIAFEAGFNNLSNFNRRFKDVKRMTPRAYRRLANPERQVGSKQ